MIYRCCDEKRRALVDAHPTLNGIDWLEVLDHDAPAGSPRQRTLIVRMLKPLPADLAGIAVHIDGGERIRDVGVDWIARADDPPLPDGVEKTFFTTLADVTQVLLVRTDSSGDHSAYQLGLLGGDDEAPPTGFDPRLSRIEFRFKVECPSDFDCAEAQVCLPEPATAPDLNYLARDYESLRRVIIDRLSKQMPGWRDRSPADLTTTLAELIAYVGDLQHYQLDAISTEAYLHTARKRVSLRRHALLVDYHVHEGCNARAWLQLQVIGGPLPMPDDIRFATRTPGLPTTIEPDSVDEQSLLRTAEIFEPMHGVVLYEWHGRSMIDDEALDGMRFYTWGDERCCLGVGATRATLRDDPARRLRLKPGDVLIFQERLGPRSGEAEDADPAHRHALRLTRVSPEAESLYDETGREIDRAPGALVLDPATVDHPDPDVTPQAIVEIEWAAEDALPFALCLSAQTDDAHGAHFIDDVSVAFGNVVLADHGRSIVGEVLEPVPPPRLHLAAAGGDACARVTPLPLPPRYRPQLAQGPVTHRGTMLRSTVRDGVRVSERVAFDPAASAASALRWSPDEALPEIVLRDAQDDAAPLWTAKRDLLASHNDDRHFVLETEHDGSARLRFGDGRLGERPETGDVFVADYRVGNGAAGNVGAGSIAHAICNVNWIASVSNPLPARGGVAPETAEQVRRRAPQAFRRLERAVTAADYASMSERLPGVQRAAARARWTGSWSTMFVTVDRDDGVPVDAAFSARALAHLERYRMAGHDVHIANPIYVSLEIELLVCVHADYFRSDVRAALLDVLGSRVRSDGTLGLFHPDRLSFGQTVYLSPLYAAARGVPGVVSTEVRRFTRQGQDDAKPLADGYLALDPLQIPRLDNDVNFPEHGVLLLELHGGK